MVTRARTRAVAHSWWRRITPRWHSMEYEVEVRLHDQRTEPGLTGLSDTGFIDRDGVRIAWYECGARAVDAEATVVFIHGYCLSAESFYAVADHVRREFPTVRCLLVDLRGHGQSAEVAPEQCTVSNAADDVLAVIAERASEGPLVIVGHSLGGMVAQNLIRRAPRSVLERVGSVVIVSSSMRRFAARGAARILHTRLMRLLYDFVLRLPNRANRLRFEVARFVAPVIAAFLQGFPQMDKLQFHVAMLLDTPMASYAGFFDDLVKHSEFGAAPRLSRIPGHIVVGEYDIVTPRSQSEVLAEHWPRAQVTVVDRAGHMVIVEEPEEVSRLLADAVRGVLGA